VTRDRDFGALVFLQRQHAGVIYLRAAPRELASVHTELDRVLGEHSEPNLASAFVVVESGRHRFRRLAG
jgi:hypothetical protein